jgi:phosphatidylserine/phosphatidylglycerophosphate/cardiolipin synthase-like enzyme
MTQSLNLSIEVTVSGRTTRDVRPTEGPTGAAALVEQLSCSHAKLVLIDKKIAIIGSATIDMRSLCLNCESALVLTSAYGAAGGTVGWLSAARLRRGPS